MLERIRDKETLLCKAKEAWEDAQVADKKFQTQARESFKFRDGDQWDKLEKDILAEERRPALTLNVVKSHIDLVMGLNEDLKKRYTCTPVAKEDGFLCEVMNNVNYWLYQKSDWEAEEDLAFESALICGRGYVNIDYDVDEKKLNEIKITQTSIPVHEVRFDPAARKRDLSDASYIIWDRWFSLEDFCVKFPSKEKVAKDAFDQGKWPKTNYQLALADGDEGMINNDINDESDYADEMDVSYYDTKKKLIRVAHMEYNKYVKKWFYWNPEEREWLPVPKNNKKEFQKATFPKMFPGKQLVLENTIEKEVWWMQFCGDEILVHAKSPIEFDGFSIVPCFLFGDVSRKNPDHYGIVELMKDPQLELNKRVSQTLNLFNQQVQPGVYAETTTFVNDDQAEQSIKEAGSITWLADGAMSQGKFQERTVPTFPTAVLQMGEYAREMLRYITGINPDMLGMNDKRKEAGIVVQLRQQQGMAILKKVFQAYSFLRKQLFERQIRIIMAHMPSKQIKKILGEGDRYKVDKGVIVDSMTGLQCDFRNVTDAAYDIDAEPESNSLTTNSLEIATYLEMQQQGMPVDPKVIINKTNLPASEKVAWLEYLEEQQQQAQDANDQAMQLEQKKLEMQHEREMAKIESNMQIQMAKLGLQEEKDQLKVAVDQAKIQAQISRDAQTAQLKFAQLMTQVAAGDADRKQELLEIMLDADYDRKRLILDTMEIMAEARMSGDKLAMDLVRDMYKAAMDASESTKLHKVTLLNKALDVMSSGKEAVLKAKTDIAKEVIKGKLQERAAAKASQGGSDNGTGK